MMNYDEALTYIHSVCWKGTIPGLSRTRELLKRMGNPERKLKFVHIAGTNGKGSTAAMTASILRKAGYRTGLYTSPFLFRFNERMNVDGLDIADQELAEITEFVKPHAEAMAEHPTEFELVTAIAMEYFARHRCDIVVLEVGLGGALDSTNVIDPPEVAVICNIGLDHTEILGNTLEEVASAKAGIIKPGCQVALYQEAPSVDAVFEAACKEQGAKLHRADFDAIVPVSHGFDGQVFDYKSWWFSPRWTACGSGAGAFPTRPWWTACGTWSGPGASSYCAGIPTSLPTAATIPSAWRPWPRMCGSTCPAGRSLP